MTFDLHSAAATWRDRARACAIDMVAPEAARVDLTGMVPDAVRQAARLAVPAEALGDLVALAAIVEELAAASAAVALDAGGAALGIAGSDGSAGPALQWPGLRGADVDGLRAALAGDLRWDTTVTAALIGLGRAALELARTALREARDGGAPNAAAQTTLADAATLVDAARLLAWDAARSGRAGEVGAAARAMARLQALDAVSLAVAAAEHATGAEASRPGTPLERLRRDAATLARVCGDALPAQLAVAAGMRPA